LCATRSLFFKHKMRSCRKVTFCTSVTRDIPFFCLRAGEQYCGVSQSAQSGPCVCLTILNRASYESAETPSIPTPAPASTSPRRVHQYRIHRTRLPPAIATSPSTMMPSVPLAEPRPHTGEGCDVDAIHTCSSQRRRPAAIAALRPLIATSTNAAERFHCGDSSAGNTGPEGTPERRCVEDGPFFTFPTAIASNLALGDPSQPLPSFDRESDHTYPPRPESRRFSGIRVTVLAN